MQYATALAQIADADFIESVVQAKSLLDRVGGEFTIAAYREKLDGEGRPAQDRPGTYETLGYRFYYDHHSKLTHSPAEPNAKREEPSVGLTDDEEELLPSEDLPVEIPDDPDEPASVEEPATVG